MTNYVPFLKSKSNEIIALSELDKTLLGGLTPFFDYPKKKEGQTPDEFKASIAKLKRSLKKHVSDFQEIYFDTYDLDDTFEVDGDHHYRHLLEELSIFNIVPVISIDRSSAHQRSVFDLKQYGVLSSDVVAFRITPEDFQSFGVIEDDIESELKPIFDLFQAVDLIFDCRVCSNFDPAKISKEIVEFAQRFSESYSPRRLIVTGSSITASIGEIVDVESERIIERSEIDIFKAVTKRAAGALEFVFGDYATVSPNYSDIEIIPEILRNLTAPKLIYSFDNQHYVIRGGSLKTKGAKQYFKMAATLCAKPFFRKAPYSLGDQYFEQKSRGEGKDCAPNTVVKPSVNAHITYILRNSVTE